MVKVVSRKITWCLYLFQKAERSRKMRRKVSCFHPIEVFFELTGVSFFLLVTVSRTVQYTLILGSNNIWAHWLIFKYNFI